MKRIIVGSILLTISASAFDICGEKTDLNSKTFPEKKSEWIVGDDISGKFQKYEKLKDNKICTVYVDNNTKDISNFNIHSRIDQTPILSAKIDGKIFKSAETVNFNGEENTYNDYEKYSNAMKAGSSLKILKSTFLDDIQNERINVTVLCIGKETKCSYNLDYYTSKYVEKKDLLDVIDSHINANFERVKAQENLED